MTTQGETSNSNAGSTLKRLEDILSQPANRVCADCDSPDPKWARKYELEQFVNSNVQNISSSSSDDASGGNSGSSQDKKQDEKRQAGHHRRHSGYGQAFNFRNSWIKSEQKAEKKKTSGIVAQILWNESCTYVGHISVTTPCQFSRIAMVEFVGLIKVNVIKGTNLAIRDVVSSDPYVIITMGHQSVKTRVIKSNLNPVWNEMLMLSIPDPIPPLKLLVYDKDKFSTDDRMGETEIDIQPLVSAAKAYENSTISESMQLGKWLASEDNTLVKDSVISLVDGKVKQEITLRLQNVERGDLEIELECVLLSQ